MAADLSGRHAPDDPVEAACAFFSASAVSRVLNAKITMDAKLET